MYDGGMSSAGARPKLHAATTTATCPVCAARGGDVPKATRGRTACAGSTCRRRTRPALGPGLTREAALARLHLRRPDGSLVAAPLPFTGLRQSLPRWSWLGRLALFRSAALRLLEAATAPSCCRPPLAP
ncbi:MAG: hypothetical protein MZV65_32860 [Chromatiales bacterium]|nr:hypothetical protein [Chromatiales bacterium]